MYLSSFLLKKGKTNVRGQNRTQILSCCPCRFEYPKRDPVVFLNDGFPKEKGWPSLEKIAI
jgi:hypothetical protein